MISMIGVVVDGGSSMEKRLITHDEESAPGGSSTEKRLITSDEESALDTPARSRSTLTTLFSQSRSSVIDRVFTERFEFRIPYAMYSRIETVVFSACMSLTATVLGSFRALEGYVPIESFCLSLLGPYLVFQYWVLRQMAHHMINVAPDIVINQKYLACVLVVMAVALMSSMVVPKYSSPIAASIPMAFLWRVGLSACGVLIFCRIDSFFTNYHAYVRAVTNREQQHGANETADALEDAFLEEHKVAFLKANKYLYVGFGLCAFVNAAFYFLVYYFNKSVCQKVSVVMYCSLIYVLCSTYFLLRTCELTKAVSGWQAASRADIKVKVKVLHWEPSGDLMVAYALGLLFVVFANFINALHKEC